MTTGTPGISGFAAYVPPYRVRLQDWCEWTGNSWEKTQAVVGDSFRMAGPDQNVYTIAAEAVLRLILEHELDPRRVGYLALGTESSTDNATSWSGALAPSWPTPRNPRTLPSLSANVRPRRAK